MKRQSVERGDEQCSSQLRIQNAVLGVYSCDDDPPTAQNTGEIDDLYTYQGIPSWTTLQPLGALPSYLFDPTRSWFLKSVIGNIFFRQV